MKRAVPKSTGQDGAVRDPAVILSALNGHSEREPAPDVPDDDTRVLRTEQAS